jgi:hypothetical protein
MHTYRRAVVNGRTIFRVGYFDETDKAERWQIVHEFDTELDAAPWASYLNGGALPKKLKVL